MNEFDLFVRHAVKPLAYVRYGDDFILICAMKTDAENARFLSQDKLTQMGLYVNDFQDKIVRSWQGLHFLGHVISKDGSIVSKKTKNLMMCRLNLQSINSYSSLKLDEETRRKLPWQVQL